LMNLRKKVPVKDFFSYFERNSYAKNNETNAYKKKEVEKIEIGDSEKKKLKGVSESLNGTDKAVFLNKNFEEIKSVSSKSVSGILKRLKEVFAIVIDGSATGLIVKSSEESGVQVIVAKNFQTTDTKIKLLSF
ncbi:MAG: hypothetical protein Q8Q04_02055, partial [archaeon]|nr:hypothetical protein [archaeon]